MKTKSEKYAKKTLKTQSFHSAGQRLKVQLLRCASGKPYRVRVTTFTEKGKVLDSGYVGVDVNEEPITKCYDWALGQAEAKGWTRGRHTGGYSLRMLSGIPAAPGAAPAKGNGSKDLKSAPVASSRLLRQMDSALGRRA